MFNAIRSYCIFLDDNVLGTSFSLHKDLRSATSWEEVNMSMLGELSNTSSSISWKILSHFTCHQIGLSFYHLRLSDLIGDPRFQHT